MILVLVPTMVFFHNLMLRPPHTTMGTEMVHCKVRGPDLLPGFMKCKVAIHNQLFSSLLINDCFAAVINDLYDNILEGN